MAFRQRMAGEYGDGSTRRDGGGEERSLGELFRELADGASTLVRQEVELAKAEIRETMSAMGRDAARVGVAAAVGLIGLQCVAAFVVIGLGAVLNNYWLSALLVGVVFLAVAALLATGALRDMKRQELKPEETLQTLRADKEWAGAEVRDLKRRIRA